MNTILFPGSFNPFTVGHRSLVERVLPLFDRVVIAIGVNSQKACEARTRERLDAIRALYAAEPKVSVIAYSGLTVDACEAEGARWMLRGVRSVADFEYERNLADANRLLEPAIETVLLPALPDLAVISSSLVRELARFGAPYEQFLP